MRRTLRWRLSHLPWSAALAACALALSGCPDDGNSAEEPTTTDTVAAPDGVAATDGAIGGVDGDPQVDADASGGDLDAAADGGGTLDAAADGGGTSDTGPAPGDAALDGGQDGGGGELPDGAWGTTGDPLPDGAVLVTESELTAMEEDGVWVQTPPDYEDKAAAAAEARHAANLAIVEAFVAEHPELEERMLGSATDPATTPTEDGNYEVTVHLGAGVEQKVILQGERAKIATIASALQRFPTLENQTALFERIAPLMPEGCTSLVPDAAGLAALSAKELDGLNRQMSECWWASEMAPLEAPADDDPPLAAPPTVNPDDVVSPDSAEGVGSLDNDDGSCGPPTQPWFGSSPFSAYLSTVKQQGHRGTCVSFATASAMEYMVARAHKRWVNLSEQSLYAKAKLQWYGEPWGDGLPTGDFIEDLADKGWSVPFELIWDYNPSWDRIELPGTYMNSCTSYEGGACSDTTHQGEKVCVGPGGYVFCGYYMPDNPTGSGWAVKSEFEVLSWFPPNTAMVKALLATGLPLVGAFEISAGWQSDTTTADGYLGLFPVFVPGKSIGGHAVHLVGWIPNAKLAKEHRDLMGGGRYVIKNSWGCGSVNDHGYYYLPESWFNAQVRSVRAVTVKKKGGNLPPVIEIVQPKYAASVPYGGLLSTVTLTAEVEDPEDGVGCCSVTWHSTVDGPLGEGLSIETSFPTAGLRAITATVQDSQGAKSTATVFVFATNSPPSVTITQPAVDGANVYKGASVLFAGQASDPNQFGGVPCDSFTWTSSKAGDPMPLTGCSVDAIFTTLGPRTITLAAKDQDGGKGSAQRTINVVEAPPGTKPIVTIISPKAGDLLDPDKFGQVTATAVDPDGSTNMTYSWTIQVGGGPETEINTALSFFWKPGTHIPFDCGGNVGTLRFYATDEDGTSMTSVKVSVAYPPC